MTPSTTKLGTLFEGTKSRIDLLDKRGVRIRTWGLLIALLALYIWNSNSLWEVYFWSPMPEGAKFVGTRAPNVIVPFLISKTVYISGYAANAGIAGGPSGWEITIRSISYLVHCIYAAAICWLYYCGRLNSKGHFGGAVVIYLVVMQCAPLNYRSQAPITEGTDHYFVAAYNSHLAKETKEALSEAPDELIGPASFILAQYTYQNRKAEELLPPLLDKIRKPWPGISVEEKRRLAIIIDFVESKSKQAETGSHVLPPVFTSVRNPPDDTDLEKTKPTGSKDQMYSLATARKVSGPTNPIVPKPRLVDQITSRVNTVTMWMFVFAAMVILMARGVRKKATAFRERFDEIGRLKKQLE